MTTTFSIFKRTHYKSLLAACQKPWENKQSCFLVNSTWFDACQPDFSSMLPKKETEAWMQHSYFGKIKGRLVSGFNCNALHLCATFRGCFWQRQDNHLMTQCAVTFFRQVNTLVSSDILGAHAVAVMVFLKEVLSPISCYEHHLLKIHYCTSYAYSLKLFP